MIVYSDQVELAEGDFFSLQSATRTPPPPTWATPIGHAYRLMASAETILADTSIMIGYVGADVPPGEEAGIQLYFWDMTAPSPRWIPLDTQVDVDRNQATAAVVGPGVYRLMASITIPLEQTGWQLVPYPGQTQPVADALAGFDDHYTTVYGYDPATSHDPWQVYDVDVPTWVNDLIDLTHQEAYWIRVTTPVTLPVKGPRPQQENTLPTTASIPIPPATYYTTLNGTDDVTPEVGLPVVAKIDGHVCGQTTTRAVAGTIGFVMDVVVAAGSGATAGCGVEGRTVTFTIGETPLQRTAQWSNQRPQRLPDNPGPSLTNRIYLPLLSR